MFQVGQDFENQVLNGYYHHHSDVMRFLLRQGPVKVITVFSKSIS